ncbi:MAG: DUF11 domain-containing protein [Sphingopyxis sp.]|nr:DUF11 domain-containing protein [Sphingopyxis sp.]
MTTGAATAVMILSATPAVAAGTASGTVITNNVTVDYQVGGVSQTQRTAADSFTVDRKINLTVAEVGAVTTSVVPGQTGASTAFTVTNTSNAPLDFALTATQISGGTAAHGGTDNFDVTAFSLFRDVNGNNSYDSGTDTAISFIDELAADASVTILIVGNVPGTQLNTDVAGVRLTATAREAGVAATQGAAITQTVGANTAGVDTVFADTAGVVDGPRDGAHSDDDDFTVVTANLIVTKTSRVVSDPFNLGVNPKMIPGAVVEYCIAIQNTGAAPATSVEIDDNVPAELTFSAGSIRLNGTVTGTSCNADGVAGGTFADPLVEGTIASIAAGTTRTLVFQATVE